MHFALLSELLFLESNTTLLTIACAQVRSRFAMFTLSQHAHEVSAVDWSSDGSQFATGSKDGHVRCFKWNSNIASNSAEASE
jgi:WD40 repeat protein